MKTRVISAVVLLPFFLFVLIKGSMYLAFFCMMCAVIGTHEFSNAVKIPKIAKILLMIFGIFQIMLIYFLGDFTVSLSFLVLFILGSLVVFEKIKSKDAINGVFTFLYVSCSMSFVYYISDKYEEFFPYIFIIAMVTDTFAYFCGKLFGKHKLSPRLSPNKTIEGSLGGIFFCSIASLLYAYFFHKEFMPYVVIFSILGSIVSQVGDIFASSIKRDMNIKDYGYLIPGHGGIIDRADSIIFVTVYIYTFLNILNNIIKA